MLSSPVSFEFSLLKMGFSYKYLGMLAMLGNSVEGFGRF
jgi:hypothetical protein